MKHTQYKISEMHWRMGENFWTLVLAGCKEIVENGNPSGFSSMDPLTPEELQRKTRWSDNNLVIPLLFNFYHGIELMLKGFVIFAEGPQLKRDHGLINYQQKFARRYPKQNEMIGYFAKYLDKAQMPQLLQRFFDRNNLTADSFYESFKYAFSKDCTIEFDHSMLKYKGARGTQFYCMLTNDILEMRRLIGLLAKSLRG
jgi:hypothetical protein